MNGELKSHLIFNDEELQLVIELLQREQKDLPAEIHHTRTSTFKDELLKRSALVKGLLEKLQSR